MKNIFTFIKNQLSILDIVKEQTSLKRAGGYWKGHCPFHHEKTGSFTVSPEKGIFYCFGCHAGGDVISFVAKTENCSQLEAVKYLIDRYGINLPEGLSMEYSAHSADQKNLYFDICKQVALWCHGNLRKYRAPLHYLHTRGFTELSIDHFTLGYFPSGPQAIRQCIDTMKRQNILTQDLIEAHIISQGTNAPYSPFEDRLIFPIKDAIGRFRGFGGRIFKPDDQRPKYYNSRENEYFTKGTILFGLDMAKHEIQETGIAFLVEGYTDCIAMKQHGFPNTIATLGTACTVSHLKTIARYANHLYVVYDGDAAGQKAIMRLTELCWQVSLELKVITLPPKEDPASFLAKKNNLQPLIQQAQDIFHFFIGTIGKDFNSQPLNQKIKLTRTVLAMIHPIEDQLKQDFLLQKASKLFDVPFKSLREELQRLGKGEGQANTVEPEKQEPVDIIGDSEITTLEKRIFCAIIYNIQLLNNESLSYLIECMPSILRSPLKKLQTTIESDADFDFSSFFDTLGEAEKGYVSKLLIEYTGETDIATFNQLLLQLQKKQWKVIVNDMKAKLALAKNMNDYELVRQLMQDFLALKQKIMNTPIAK